ncbi:MFS transporter [Stappia taiwanensis]|uniref:MFS transporter n=1 Tax=Stappia taiwanensis TaxID=992267 RepID=A0A838XUL4_9HYPH|nr:MFS transporter [Stappia taiwanensis]MBA4610550.1 MFS transporter [Stappia taiwanensis]GGE84029.1 MFS transporter [Stappia taiwanensis]
MTTATSRTQTSVSSAPPSGREKRKIIVGVGVGNALEWYDWAAYSIFAPYFARQFFRSDDPLTDLLGTLAIFAAGFFMRPLGGVFFGWFADRRGRRPAMTFAMLLTAAGSLLIGISPTYGSIGATAAVFLLLGRLLQGFGHGGEVVSSFTYVTEMAPANRRGAWSSTVFVFVTIGVMSATALGAGLTSTVGASGVEEWAWRIPFVIGGVLGVYALYLRRHLDETPMFRAKAEAAERAAAVPGRAARQGGWANVWKYRRACLRIFALSAGGTVLYYVWAVMAPTFAIGALGMDPGPVMWVGVAANIFFILCLMAWGRISDRYGRKLNWYVFSIGSMIAIIPLSLILSGGEGEIWRLAVYMGVGMLLISAPTAIMPAFFPEQFPTHIRAVAMGLPFSVAGAVTGGTAPYLQAWLYSSGQPWLFEIYLIVLCFLVLVATVVSPETNGKDLSDDSVEEADLSGVSLAERPAA